MAEQKPSERVYITSLPKDIDNAQLKEVLTAYGTIKSTKVLQNGAAIVQFATLDEAKWVVENLDGNMPEGISAPIKVEYAWQQRDGGSFGKGEGGGWATDRASPYGKGGKGFCKGGGKGGSIQMLKSSLVSMSVLPGGRSSHDRSDAQQLYIRGLPADTTDIDLHDLFGPFGAIPARGVKAVLSPEGMCTGIGWVDFVEEACAAKAAAALNGTFTPDGNTLRVNVKKPSKGKGGKSKGDKVEA